jgi:hypothetical protein
MNLQRMIVLRRNPAIAGENGKFLKKKKKTRMMSKKKALHVKERRSIVRKGKCSSGG